MNKADREKRNKGIRAFVTSGHTYPEASKKFGLCLETLRYICKGCRDGYVNQFVSGDFDQLANVKRYISQANPDMEYVSGSTDTKGYVVLRCRTCGYEFQRSMETIRKCNRTICQHCRSVEIKNRQRLIEEEKKKAREERHAIALVNKENRRLQLIEETRKRQEERRHDCPVCGKSTTRPKYCSTKCGLIANRKKHSAEQNAAHEARRRVRIKSQLVDKDISLKRLYDRAGGQCWICGMPCDYTDKTYTDKTMIAGDLYPSIDHVIALSDGGTHAWDNVRLAHRICNVMRYYLPGV